MANWQNGNDEKGPHLELAKTDTAIALVTPPSEFLLDERVFMSLGILKVAAALEAGGVQVEHLDLSGVENFMDVVAEYARTHRPSCYALTATTPQMPSALRIAALLRGQVTGDREAGARYRVSGVSEEPTVRSGTWNLTPETYSQGTQNRKNPKVILGGPHATLVNAAARKEVPAGRACRAMQELLSAFDTVVAGDGERAIFSAIKESGLIDADNPKSEMWQSSADFNESAWPARHLVDVESYHYTVDGERALSLVGQLGCPFECAFCGGRLSSMLRRIRTRSAESVVAEMLHLHDRYGIRGLMFYDDELNVNKAVVGLMRSIRDTGQERGIAWRLRGFVKAELFTEEQAEAMYAAGFRWLLCGFESAHPVILRNINKKATVADNTNMLRMAHKHGLKVKALMSFGHPGESETTIMATRDWLIAEKPDDFDCTIITTYPGCPYYDAAKELEKGLYVFNTWGDKLYAHDVDYARDAMYYKGKPGDYKSYVWTDHLTPERLVELRDRVEEEVRTKLGIPYNAGISALRYEHSMGQDHIPAHILRKTGVTGQGSGVSKSPGCATFSET